MPNMSITFQDAIDAVESLPDYQQEDLIEVVKSRLIEQKRENLAKSIQSARDDLKRGNVQTGTVSDLIEDLSK